MSPTFIVKNKPPWIYRAFVFADSLVLPQNGTNATEQLIPRLQETCAKRIAYFFHGYNSFIVHSTITRDDIDDVLGQVAIEEVWGIGTKYAQFLRNYGIQTARDL